MAQPEQPQPQEVLPFLLSLTILMTISVTTAASTAQMIIVERFSAIHVMIYLLKLSAYSAIASALSVPLSLWGLTSI